MAAANTAREKRMEDVAATHDWYWYQEQTTQLA
jgi:hypothetical protein